jgi:hypothetical protein
VGTNSKIWIFAYEFAVFKEVFGWTCAHPARILASPLGLILFNTFLHQLLIKMRDYYQFSLVSKLIKLQIFKARK